ncbi:MAG: hypothetical protein HYY18_10600 [Planctomycetes bacterium]|nr:hypothetical protein [Planctomycetota bacterium]
MKIGAFLVVFFGSIIVGGMTWLLVKNLARFGVLLIPVAGGALAAFFTPEKTNRFEDVFVIIMWMSLLTSCAMGTLACALYSDVLILQRQVRELGSP